MPPCLAVVLPFTCPTHLRCRSRFFSLSWRSPSVPTIPRRCSKQEHYARTVHYILTTGANWKGPIKSFKLTIAKESPNDKVSVCLPDTRKATPTTFEVVRKDFLPTQDLKILFIPSTQ